MNLSAANWRASILIYSEIIQISPQPPVHLCVSVWTKWRPQRKPLCKLKSHQLFLPLHSLLIPLIYSFYLFLYFCFYFSWNPSPLNLPPCRIISPKSHSTHLHVLCKLGLRPRRGPSLSRCQQLPPFRPRLPPQNCCSKIANLNQPPSHLHIRMQIRPVRSDQARSYFIRPDFNEF